MVAQPAAASLSAFHSPSHLHIAGETCPTCGQDIPPDKLEEINGRIAAREREQKLAITERLEQKYGVEKAEAAAKAAADLEAVRRQSAEREAAARDEARQVAEAAAAERQAQQERNQQEVLAAVQKRLTDEGAARLAAEQVGASLQTQFQRLLHNSKEELAAAKAEAAARENEIREEARRVAQETVAAQLATAETACQQATEALQTRTTELEAARTAAAQQAFASQAQLAELQQAKDAEITQVKERAAAETLLAREEATATAAAITRSQLAEKDQAIAAAQARSAEAEDKLAALTELQQATLKQELDGQREILEKAKDEALNAEKARAFDETQKLQNKLNEMQRALEKKTADELGEGAEVNLFEALKDEFREDRIERIAKGTPGADVHHVVIYNGRECGIILYDSKNHGQYRSDHVTKLRADQLAAKADHAILSTRKFPAKTGQLHMEGGILLANPARVVTLVKLLRQIMIQIHSMRMSSVEREEKTAALYDFITSDRCSQFLSRIDANAQGLLDLQVKERKFHDKAWEKEGELIKQIQKAQGDLSTEICRIIGTAADPEPELEESEL
jgi:hypothetical protein